MLHITYSLHCEKTDCLLPSLGEKKKEGREKEKGRWLDFFKERVRGGKAKLLKKIKNKKLKGEVLNGLPPRKL